MAQWSSRKPANRRNLDSWLQLDRAQLRVQYMSTPHMRKRQTSIHKEQSNSQITRPFHQRINIHSCTNTLPLVSRHTSFPKLVERRVPLVVATFSSTHAAQVLKLLSTGAIGRQNEMEQFERIHPQNTDEENGSDALIYENFYNEGGATAIIEIKNLKAPQFLRMHTCFQNHIKDNYNVVRSCKCLHTAEGALFMSLEVLKHEGHGIFLLGGSGRKHLRLYAWLFSSYACSPSWADPVFFHRPAHRKLDD